MEKFIEALKYIGLFMVGIVIIALLQIVIIALLQIATEEKPHRVIIEGKTYIRSKEYAGNGTYQVILIPVDSTQTK